MDNKSWLLLLFSEVKGRDLRSSFIVILVVQVWAWKLKSTERKLWCYRHICINILCNDVLPTILRRPTYGIVRCPQSLAYLFVTTCFFHPWMSRYRKYRNRTLLSANQIIICYMCGNLPFICPTHITAYLSSNIFFPTFPLICKQAHTKYRYLSDDHISFV